MLRSSETQDKKNGLIFAKSNVHLLITSKRLYLNYNTKYDEDVWKVVVTLDYLRNNDKKRPKHLAIVFGEFFALFCLFVLNILIHS